MRESLYEIPPGCICCGDGLLGAKCEATEHAKLRRRPDGIPTDRTPQQWTEFCAEKVMGWEWRMGVRGTPAEARGGWRDECGIEAAGASWSPYENPADALEVLERLRHIEGARHEFTQGSTANIRIKDDAVDIALMRHIVTGPHFGPAVCLLAEKILDAG